MSNLLSNTTEPQGQSLESVLNSSQSPDLVLHYKDQGSNGLIWMAVASPVWALWLPWLLLTNLSSLADLQTLAFAAFFAFIILSAVLTIAICLDNKLIISSSGIRIPSRFLLHTRGKVRFNWADLTELSFRKNGKPSAEANNMVFIFKNAISVPFKMDGFPHEDMPKIMLAMQAFAPTVPISPDPDKLPYGNGKNSKLSLPLSFTKIWQDELNNRFGSTIFVPLEPNTSLQNGRIKIVGHIAFGGLSAIYLARLDDEKLVVIKEAVVPANADEASREKAIEMFNREACFLITLDHPRIAKVFDHFMEGARNYLLLEYIEGKDLRTYVKENGPVPEQVVVRWAIQIGELLMYLHSLNPPIIHRDLTPDNLVLAKDGTICLIDFGAANAFMGTATGTLVGKQSYISPEQFRGKAVPDSDIYSMGCTLHYLLTGKDPEALDISHPCSILGSISKPIDDFVAALTQQETADRLSPASKVVEQANSLIVIKKHSH